MKKGISPVISVILLLFISLVLAIFAFYFSKSVQTNIMDLGEKKIKKFKNSLPTQEKKVNIILLSENSKKDVIKEFLEQQGYSVNVMTFKTFYNNFNMINGNNFIFLGRSEGEDLKLLQLINKMKMNDYKMIFLFDDDTPLPNIIKRITKIYIFPKRSLIKSDGEEDLEYLIPTPISHLKVSSELSLANIFFMERSTSQYKVSDYLLLVKDVNLLAERKPNGFVKIPDILLPKQHSPSFENGKFYYTTVTDTSIPVLVVSPKQPSSNNYLYIMCDKVVDGVPTTYVRAKEGNTLNCEYLKDYKIVSVTPEKITIRDPAGVERDYYFSSFYLECSSGNLDIIHPLIIDRIIYPLFHYSCSGNDYYVIDYTKTQYNRYNFNTYENIAGHSTFSLDILPFAFRINKEGNNYRIYVENYKENYVLPSIFKENYGFLEIYFIYSEILQGENLVLLLDILGD